MRLLWFGVFMAVLQDPVTCGKRRISSDEVREIIKKRLLTAVQYRAPSSFQRSNEPQIDCVLHMFTGRFWLVDKTLQNVEKVPSIVACVKQCYKFSGCKSVNYVQEFAYCELLDSRFVDDREQSGGTLGEITEMGEPAHADLIECKELPPGLIPPGTTSTSIATTSSLPSTSTVAPNPQGDPIPEVSQCGTARYPPKITAELADPSVTGTEPIPNTWPWTVNIFYMNQHRCTGSLVRVSATSHESDIVLTSANCLTSKGTAIPAANLRVILGCHRTNENTPGQITAAVASYVQMPQYSTSYFQKDAAVIKLDKLVAFTSTILPVCLPKKTDGFTIDKLCVVTGWGYTQPEAENQLVQMRITAFASSQCATKTICREQLTSTSNICGGTIRGLNPAKIIDTGSPFMCLLDGKWLQMGIAAAVNELTCLTSDTSSNAANVFVRITSIRDWINETIAKLTAVTT